MPKGDQQLKDVREWAERLSGLHQLAQAVLTRSAPEDVMAIAVRRVKSLLHAATVLLVMKEEDRSLRYAAAEGDRAHLFRGRALRPGGLQEKVIQAKRPLISVEPSQDGWAAPEEAKQMGLSSLVASPIVVDREVVGCITALRGRRALPFDDEDLSLLNLFADYVALALKDTRLHEELRLLADRDPLTGIYNHRVLMENLDREVRRVGRYGQGFCIIMMDIDNFKKINDVYGHLAGDAVLNEVAKRLQGCVRASDIVGRYGGDEFMVILTNTDEAGAVAAAQRILKQITDRPCLLEPKRISVGLSIGIAACPQDAYSRNSLIQLADMALSKAKATGKGRIELPVNEPTRWLAESHEVAVEPPVPS